MVSDVKLIFEKAFLLREKRRRFGAQNPRTHMRTRSTLHKYCVKTSLLFKYFSAPGFQHGDGMVVFNPRCFMMTFVFNLHPTAGLFS